MANTLNDHLSAALYAFQALAIDESVKYDVFHRTEHLSTIADCLEAQKRIIDVYNIVAGNKILRLHAEEENETETTE